MAPAHVLVPLDGSPLAADALTHALETFDCRVTVLNVVAPIDQGMSEGGVIGAGGDREESARERAENVVERARDRAAAAGRTVETAVQTGDPAEVIVDYTEAHGVDHVVMGSHGQEKSRIARRLLGTVSTAVVGEAPATVTVVRESGHAQQ